MMGCRLSSGRSDRPAATEAAAAAETNIAEKAWVEKEEEEEESPRNPASESRPSSTEFYDHGRPFRCSMSAGKWTCECDRTAFSGVLAAATPGKDGPYGRRAHQISSTNRLNSARPNDSGDDGENLTFDALPEPSAPRDYYSRNRPGPEQKQQQQQQQQQQRQYQEQQQQLLLPLLLRLQPLQQQEQQQQQLFTYAQPVDGYYDFGPYATAHHDLWRATPCIGTAVPVWPHQQQQQQQQQQHHEQQSARPFPYVQPATGYYYPGTYATADAAYSHCGPHHHHQPPPPPPSPQCIWCGQPTVAYYPSGPYAAAHDDHHYHHHHHHHHHVWDVTPILITAPGTIPGTGAGTFPGTVPDTIPGTPPMVVLTHCYIFDEGKSAASPH